MNKLNEILKQISNFLGLENNSLEAFILFIVFFIAAWLIKEFKDIYSKERETLSLKQIEMKEKLSSVKLSIKLYRRQEIEMKDLLESIFKINAYLNRNKYKELKNILEDIDKVDFVDKLVDFVDKLDDFVTNLLDTIMNQTNIYIIKEYSMAQDVERFSRRMKDIVLPIIAASIVIFCSCVLLTFYASGKTPFWGAMRMYSFIFFISFLSIFINSLFSKQDDTKTRIYFGIVAVLSTPLLFFENIYCLIITLLGILGVVLIRKYKDE
ncbi:hypothetical protein [Bacillus thuringiensis]|nr:hypothetical protein [Bacillus thuringiensis]EEM40553.1 hypothetical protein bthur0004_35020 [Bacillus thuringiensis serovar sotto str. T04001]MEB4893874.1 hypothetical protein [Bacillus thuringiensis]MEC2474691.1 hypothetical protein [Bacillus thuringiensis]MEC2823260.1 hypothetical protein [Bacillus thuringiensis]MEC2839730.1 hypothetical protein [Bacillus thuringiensis]